MRSRRSWVEVYRIQTGCRGRCRGQAHWSNFSQKRGIVHSEVESLEAAIAFLEVRGGQRVPQANVGRWELMKDHVHTRKSIGGLVIFLTVDRDAVRCFFGRFQEERTGTTGGIVYRHVQCGVFVDTHYFGQDSGNLGGCVKLPFAFP